MKLSFSKAEMMRSIVDMGNVGVSTPMESDFGRIGTPIEGYEVADSILSFGIFGGSDQNKFYPNIRVNEDIVPKEEDFIRVPFRLISATIVGGGSWKATDFSNTEVLKASRQKLLKKTVYKDHDHDTDNWIGIVEAVKWSEGVPQGKNRVPAGIDGVLAIDAKTSPKTARGLLIGTIYSNSVTVEFDWTPSHDFEEDYEFERKVGTEGKDGKMIRRVVTAIHDYHETSLVWLGADPYAKLIDGEGNLVNVERSATFDKEPEIVLNQYKENSSYAINFCLDKNVLSLSKKPEINSNNFKKNSAMEKILVELRKTLGLAADAEVKVEHLAKLGLVSDTDSTKVSLFDKLAGSEALIPFCGEGKDLKELDNKIEEFTVVSLADHTALTAQAGKVEQLEADKVTLQNEKTALEGNAKVGEQFTKDKRAEVVRLYKLAVGEKSDDKVIDMFNKADVDALDGLLKQYAKDSTMKFAGHCKDCGSDNFDFRSSVASKEEGSVADQGEYEKGTDYFTEKYGKSSMNIKIDQSAK